MKQTMKFAAITVAMVGLLFTANSAFAQRVSVRFTVGDARVHFQNYDRERYYGGHQRSIAYVDPRSENCGITNRYSNDRDDRFDNDRNNRYNNDRDNRYNNNSRNNGNNNGYNGGYGRKHW